MAPPSTRSPLATRAVRRIGTRLRAGSDERRLRNRAAGAPTSGEPVTVVIDAEAASTDARMARRRLDRRTSYRDRTVVFGRTAGYGEWLLFISPDVRPLNRGWLGALVAASKAVPGAVAIGPVVVRSRPRGLEGFAGYRPGWFRGVPGGVEAEVPDPGALPGGHQEVMAGSGACLLVRRTAYEAIGGRDESYRAAWWDIDLCARLRQAGGKVMISQEAFVRWDSPDPRRSRDADHDRSLFAARWAVDLGREARTGYAGIDEPVTAVVGSPGDLAWDGAITTYPPESQPSADRLVVADAGYDRTERTGATVKVALAGADPEPWRGFDPYDVVGVAGADLATDLGTRIAAEPVDISRDAGRLLPAVSRAAAAPRIAWRIGSPAGEEAERWGDTHLARHLAAALRPLGFASTITPLPYWDHPAHQAVDIAVHLHGLSEYTPKRGHLNVLWVISHPERVTAAMAERFDLVLVASEPFAEKLAATVSVPVRPFLQATNTHLFRPRDVERDIPVLFVGNSRRRERPIVRWAIERGLPLTVYGGDWEGIIPDEFVASRFVPNNLLPELYARAQVALNDHWPDMAEHGFISNRVFDVSATGTALVTDAVAGLETAVGDSVVVVDDAGGLQREVERLLGDPGARATMGTAGFDSVRRRHTMDLRAQQLVSELRSLSDRRVGALLERAEPLAAS